MPTITTRHTQNARLQCTNLQFWMKRVALKHSLWSKQYNHFIPFTNRTEFIYEACVAHTRICSQFNLVGVLCCCVQWTPPHSYPPHTTGIISSSYTALPSIHIVETCIYILPSTSCNPSLKPAPRAFLLPVPGATWWPNFLSELEVRGF